MDALGAQRRSTRDDETQDDGKTRILMVRYMGCYLEKKLNRCFSLTSAVLTLYGVSGRSSHAVVFSRLGFFLFFHYSLYRIILIHYLYYYNSDTLLLICIHIAYILQKNEPKKLSIIIILLWYLLR